MLSGRGSPPSHIARTFAISLSHFKRDRDFVTGLIGFRREAIFVESSVIFAL